MRDEIREKLYKKNKAEFTRHLRHNMTPEEIILWEELRNRQCNKMKFRKQVNIGPYIADFLCIQHRLIVEVDGSVHNQKERKEYDHRRDEYLLNLNYRVLRITNDEIHQSLSSVLDRIHEYISSPSPADLRQQNASAKSESGATK
ncbi:endonuclease domain-containing protein [Patescibacteria group bacterium]|nr:endonuclease domain-containing protein [Patescibacteria group bacterium]